MVVTFTSLSYGQESWQEIGPCFIETGNDLDYGGRLVCEGSSRKGQLFPFYQETEGYDGRKIERKMFIGHISCSIGEFCNESDAEAKAIKKATQYCAPDTANRLSEWKYKYDGDFDWRSYEAAALFVCDRPKD